MVLFGDFVARSIEMLTFDVVRSIFMWYMWKIQDVNVNALEQKA